VARSAGLPDQVVREPAAGQRCPASCPPPSRRVPGALLPEITSSPAAHGVLDQSDRLQNWLIGAGLPRISQPADQRRIRRSGISEGGLAYYIP
jgi:hypothetical protein